MKPLTDIEFDEWFRKFLLKHFPSDRVLDYELDEIAWALNHGVAEAIDGKHWYIAPIMVSHLDDRKPAKSEQQALLTYIIEQLNGGFYAYERIEDDLVCLRQGIIKGSLKGYFDVSSTTEGTE